MRNRGTASLTRGRAYDFTILRFARFRCAIRDLALLAITSAATSASLIVRSILSGAIPRRIRLSITFFLRSDLTAFLIFLASANISFGIFVIPLHYRVSIYGANLIGVLHSSRSAAKSKRVRSQNGSSPLLAKTATTESKKRTAPVHSSSDGELVELGKSATLSSLRCLH